MPIDPIKPYSDPRVAHGFATVNGRKYHYVDARPTTTQKGVALLLHGFPDLWYGWRYIIPHLQTLGLRCIVPDCLGYGQSDSPQCPPNPLHLYSLKSMSSDMISLLTHLHITTPVLLVSHDWGAMFATRLYLHHPTRILAIACICVPFSPPIKTDIKLADIVKKHPNFWYQLSFAKLSIEDNLKTPEQIATFLNAIYYVKEKSRGRAKEVTDPPTRFDPNNLDADVLTVLGNPPKSPLWRDGDLEYYVEQFSRNGMNGPFNWYRTREGITYEDEKDLTINTIPISTLYIGAAHDSALPPSMSRGQENFATNLTTEFVKTSHWAMVEDPESVNEILGEWITGKVFAGQRESREAEGGGTVESML